MASVSELRVFYNLEEMKAGMRQFTDDPDALIKWGRGEVVLSDDYVILFMRQDGRLGDDWIKGVPMSIAGLCLCRVWCDVRVPFEVTRYCMARMLHHKFPVDNHIKVFYKEIRE
ncbi:hypothetical protein PMW_81 [Pseudomonas phage phiPMW]|uniref:Uncharacterized protein n=1 Tax=Pseudomonas phage phiPMW TaxID=1815582 RepID=A0A1S5R1C0_9CAUD|nr:hypothetical protein FDG97_gp081 [Pseudomonas phage phiPMW]ANA49206.1 hypothetical protein PMW_81 [Pseudomonas phage phiPMW]